MTCKHELSILSMPPVCAKCGQFYEDIKDEMKAQEIKEDLIRDEVDDTREDRKIK